MTTPKPGIPMRGSRTGRPLMVLLDLLGRRWSLRILWELREETVGFRVLQDRCDRMSPSVLSQRLMELQEAGILQQNESGTYTLTSEGLDLLRALAPLNDWALRWAKRAEEKSTTAGRLFRRWGSSIP
jgi:DNA-binding HxlR family transcriptional regulator